MTRTILVSNAVTPSVSIAFTGCPGNTLTFTPAAVNGGSNPQYSWFVNNVLQTTGSNFTLNNATNGTQVYARMTSNASCASTATVNSATITVNCVVTAVSAIDGLESFSVSPNPSGGIIQVHLKLQRMKTVSFAIVDGNGKTISNIYAGRVSGNHFTTIDLGSYAQGIYYLRTTIGNESFVKKVVIVR
jgi:hypothetical protein